MKFINYHLLSLLLTFKVVFVLIVVIESQESDKMKRRNNFDYQKDDRQAQHMILSLLRWQPIGFPDFGSDEFSKTLNPIEQSKLFNQKGLVVNISVNNLARKPLYM